MGGPGEETEGLGSRVYQGVGVWVGWPGREKEYLVEGGFRAFRACFRRVAAVLCYALGIE